MKPTRLKKKKKKNSRLDHRLHGSSFVGLPYRILIINHKKELRWSLWVTFTHATLKPTGELQHSQPRVRSDSKARVTDYPL